MGKSNKWIDEVFKSVQHQKQPTLHVGVFSKIEHRINTIEVNVVLMPIWKIAAATAVIVSVNLLAFNNRNTREPNFKTTEYHLLSNYNFYANE